jgi:hypothetical protein
VSSYTAASKGLTTIDFILNVIPTTVFDAFTKGEILQVLLFSVLFGLAALSLGKSVAPLVALLDQTGKTLFAIVGIIMRLAPIGAFGAMAFTVGRYGVGSLLSLGQLMAGMYVTCLLFVFGLMGWFHVPIYLTIAVMPVLLTAMAVTDEIHVYSRYFALLHESPRGDHRALVQETMGNCAPLAGTKPPTSFTSSVPPKVSVPATCKFPNWLVWFPPTLILSVPAGFNLVWFKVPSMERVPKGFPGLTTPRLRMPALPRSSSSCCG